MTLTPDIAAIEQRHQVIQATKRHFHTRNHEANAFLCETLPGLLAAHRSLTARLERMEAALEIVKILCCYPETEDISCNRDDLLTHIRKVATEGKGEQWKG